MTFLVMADALPKGVVPAFFSAEVVQSRRFYFDLAPPRHRFSVVCGGVEVCAENYAIHRQEGFPFLCLEYVLQGCGGLSLAGAGRELGAGSVFAYGPGVPIHIVNDPRHPLTKYFVCFAGKGAAEALSAAGLRSGESSAVAPAHALVKLFDEIVEAGLHGGSAGQALCVSLLKALFLKCAAAAGPPGNTASNAYLTYRRCRQFAEEHYLQLHTLDDLAVACGVNPSYLCRLFRKCGQESPYHFLQRLKMHHAATLLQQSGIAVKEAASAVGFSDQMHFSRVFRKILKVAPTSLRAIR